MARTFCEMTAAISEIQSRVNQDNAMIDQGIAMLNTSSSNLQGIGGSYPNFTADMNAAIAANPGNVAYSNLLAEYTETTKDLQAAYAKVSSLLNAINDVLNP
jgi:hypothetical protein